MKNPFKPKDLSNEVEYIKDILYRVDHEDIVYKDSSIYSEDISDNFYYMVFKVKDDITDIESKLLTLRHKAYLNIHPDRIVSINSIIISKPEQITFLLKH